jgi:hypothetical protein
MKYTTDVLDYEGRIFEMPHRTLFPKCQETRDALVLDIRANGVMDPVKLWKDGPDCEVVVDGHTRLEIANSLRIPLANITFHYIEAKTLSEAMEKGVRMNVTRRALDREQIAELCVKLRKEYEWSLGRIAEVICIPKTTVHRYLEGYSGDDLPTEVKTADGRSYPSKPKKPKKPKKENPSIVPNGTMPTEDGTAETPNQPPEEDDPSVAALEGEWGGDDVPVVNAKDSALKLAIQSLAGLLRSLKQLGILNDRHREILQEVRDDIESCRNSEAA